MRASENIKAAGKELAKLELANTAIKREYQDVKDIRDFETRTLEAILEHKLERVHIDIPQSFKLSFDKLHLAASP